MLVTGGAGFIGRRLVSLLAASGHRVIALDNLASGLPFLAADGVSTVECDVRDEDGLGAAFAKWRPEAVVHLAAVHHIPTCETERAYSLDVNVTGTERVLAAAEGHGVQRLILASSGAVYDVVEGPLSEDTTPTAPSDNYSLAKVTNEAQARFWAARTGGDVTLARVFNTIGPGDPNAHLVPDVLAQLGGQGGGVVRLGNLSPRRDYVAVEDVARAFAAAVDLAPEGVAVVNVCSGHEYSVADLVRIIGELLGRSLKIEVDAGRVRPIDRPQQLGDPVRARDVLGWEATTPLAEALRAILVSEGLLPGRFEVDD